MCLWDVWGEDALTYPEDYGKPPQGPQQGYGQQSRQDPPWHPQQYDYLAHQQRTGPQQGPVGQQYPGGPQPWEQPNRQQPYGQPWPPRDQPYAPQPPPQPQQSAMPPQTPRGRRRKSWPARHKVLTGLIAFGALVVIIVAHRVEQPVSPGLGHQRGGQFGVTVSGVVIRRGQRGRARRESSDPSTPAAPAGPSMTVAQQQAVDAAGGYLGDGQGFSEQGLLSQLTSSAGDGFSKSDAEFAIKYLNPDWDRRPLIPPRATSAKGRDSASRDCSSSLRPLRATGSPRPRRNTPLITCTPTGTRRPLMPLRATSATGRDSAAPA